MTNQPNPLTTPVGRALYRLYGLKNLVLAPIISLVCLVPAMATEGNGTTTATTTANTTTPLAPIEGIAAPVVLRAELMAAQLGLSQQLPYVNAAPAVPSLLLADEPKDKAVPKNRQRKKSIFDVNKPRKHFNLKLNLFQLYVGSINILPEIRASDHNTLTPGVEFGKRKDSGVDFEYFTLTPEYRRYYFRDKKGDFHKGYFGAYLRYRNEQSSSNSVYSSAGAGLLIGQQFLVLDVLSLDIFAGYGYYFYSESRRGKQAVEKEPGRGDLRIGICIGIAPE